MGKRVEGNGSLLPCLDIFKISKGNGVISHFSYLDVLKIRMEMRGNDLNRQIYPYLNFFYLINKAKSFFLSFYLFFCYLDPKKKEKRKLRMPRPQPQTSKRYVAVIGADV